jgi:hypothetical protein
MANNKTTSNAVNTPPPEETPGTPGKDKMTDLGLSYEAAAHGVQAAIAFDMSSGKTATLPKHLRVGIDMQKADMLALVCLLIDKGIMTPEEYDEYLRLAANTELHTREQEHARIGSSIKFR